MPHSSLLKSILLKAIPRWKNEPSEQRVDTAARGVIAEEETRNYRPLVQKTSGTS